MGTQPPCPKRDGAPNFGRLLWPNGCMDYDASWHGGSPRPTRHCVLWGPSSPSPKGAQPPVFGPYLLRPNGCMDQYVTCNGGRPRPRRLCVRWGPRSPLTKGGGSPQIFGPCLLWMKLVLGMEVGLSPGDGIRWGPSPLPKRGRSPLPNFRSISFVAKRLDASRCHLLWM